MGAVSPFRIILSSILLVATVLLAQGIKANVPLPIPKAPLRDVFDQGSGWSDVRTHPLSDQVVEGLKLDDYLFRSFMKGEHEVTLYVGYYRSAQKVGAAHDPLVCFQGQGWEIVEQTRGHYTLTRPPGVTISYSSMIAERRGDRELIVYWFQTNGRTSADTFTQKVDMVRDRLFGYDEDNAFIRISTPVGEGSRATAQKKILDFVEAFYPAFYGYMARK